MDDKQVFDRIARELSSDCMEPRLWAAALAECDNDRERARTLYIRRRHDQLADGAGAEGGSAAEGGPRAEQRRELVRLLAQSGRGSLYASLGVPASASDAELAEAIAALQRQGGERTAEVRYAVETLGDPGRRAEYDRRLLDQLALATGSAVETGAGTAFASGAGSGRAGFRMFPHGLLVAAVLLGGGYLTMQLAEDGRVAHEAAVAQKRAEAAQAADAALKNSEKLRIEQLRQQAEFAKSEEERLAREKLAEEAKAQERLELERDVLKERRLAEEKMARQAKARAQAEMDAVLAAEEAERQVVEKAKRDREYWSCMNKALDDTDQAGAKAKCSGLRDGSSQAR